MRPTTRGRAAVRTIWRSRSRSRIWLKTEDDAATAPIKAAARIARGRSAVGPTARSAPVKAAKTTKPPIRGFVSSSQIGQCDGERLERSTSSAVRVR